MKVTLHFQSTGTVPGNGSFVTMVGQSMTVGRSDQNEMVLPDPDKTISSRHCAIENHNGNIVVIDLSTNGTFLNYGKMPIGKTPTGINDGDILSIGGYELLVEFGADDPAAPVNIASGVTHDLMENSVADILDSSDDGDDFLDGLLGGESPAGPSSVKRDQFGDDGLMLPMGDGDENLFAIPEDESISVGPTHSTHSSAMSDAIQTPAPATSAIPDDWEEELSVSASTGDIQPYATQEIKIPDGDFSVPTDTQASAVLDSEFGRDVRTADTAPRVDQENGMSNTAARAFLKSLGAADFGIQDDELETTLSRMGHVLRTMIQGMREVLMTRASIKSEFRINQTVISAGGNNPLKFSVSPEQAVEAIVKPTAKGYLDATLAVEQALNDIKAHEVAMMSGLEAALKGVLARLEPKELEKIITADSGVRNLLSNKKARYWEIYEKKYDEIVDQVENDFHDLFSKEFARAYQEQLERLK